MPKRQVTIKALDAVQAIRSGMSDFAIMEKFGLTAAALEQLYDHLLKAGILTASELDISMLESTRPLVADLPNGVLRVNESKKPIIDAADAVKCLKAGMSDMELMKRYGIAAKGLRSLIKKLQAKGALDGEYLKKRLGVGETLVVDEDISEEMDPESSEIRHRVSEIFDRIAEGRKYEHVVKADDFTGQMLQNLFDRLAQDGRIGGPDPGTVQSTHRQVCRILHGKNGEVLFEGKECSLGDLVVLAVRSDVDLSGADLAGVALARCDLSGARLQGANLARANLVGSDLTGANLRQANMRSSDMCAAVLHKTNLAGANLSDANMSLVYAVWAFMPQADLSETNLSRANLTGANLANCNLFESILEGANLTGAFLQGCNLDAARRST